MSLAAPRAVRTQGLAHWLRLDWGLVLAAAGLSLIGAALIWSATRDTAGSLYPVRHLVNTGVGVLIAAVVARVDLRTLRLLAPWIYVGSLIGLALVLSPVGSTVNGSRSWIRLPGLSIQPAELTKVALVVGLAMLLAERGARGAPPSNRAVVGAALFAGAPVLLVMAQPDLGSATVLVMITLGVVAVSGASRWWVIAGAAALVGAVVAAFSTPVLSGYQRNRLLAFLDPGLDPRGIGYQVQQVRLAIGSGGWNGQGLGQGRQTQGGFIPFQQTDFVFSVAGEELGLIGAGAIVLLSGFVVYRAFWIARSATDSFARLLATGVGCWLLFQTVQNIGMNLGMVPVTGLPLPFVSYGGSSMFACWAAIGLLGRAHSAGLRRG